MEETVEQTAMPAYAARVLPQGSARKVISKSNKKRFGLYMEEVVYHFKIRGVMHSITCHEPVRKQK